MVNNYPCPGQFKREIETAYSQTRLIRTLLNRNLRLILRGNLKTFKPLPSTPMLN